MANFLEELKAGDVCGISEYSRHHRNRVYRAVVLKTTKTTITVERKWGEGTKSVVFNRTNGRERGNGSSIGSSWYRDALISSEDYRASVQQNRIERLRYDKMIKREALIKALTDSVRNDDAFKLALEALNQQEYI